MTCAVEAVFNGLRGEAREKALATGNYDALVKHGGDPAEPRADHDLPREPGEDEFLDVASQA